MQFPDKYLYQNTITIEGNPGKALDTAATILMPNGFVQEERTEKLAIFRGPVMNNTRQHPLVAISRIELQAYGSKIDISAELGRLRLITRFIAIFPFALGLGLAGLFLAIMPRDEAIQSAAISLFSVSPWVVISPLMIRWLRKRTVTALEDFEENLRIASL